MKVYKKYIVHTRFKEHCIAGDVNLPYGTECECVNQGNFNFITYQGKILCATTSQQAFDFFCQNDDGEGKARGALAMGIKDYLASSKLAKNKELKDKIWEKIWEDEICLKYKRPDIDDHFLWSYDFFNGDIEDLRYIDKMIKGIKL